MDRAESLVWLQQRYATLYERARLDTEDSEEGFGPVIDSAWRLLGAEADAVIPVSQTNQWEAALDWHALKRVANEYVQRYSKALAGISLQTYQTFQGIMKLLDLATKRLVAVGLATPDGAGPMYEASYDDLLIRPRRSHVYRTYFLGGATEYG